MPMRNAAEWVHEALSSILEQNDVRIEVIVVDDGSTDDSAKIVAALGDPRVVVVSGPQRGISAAFNEGLRHAKAPFLARCDADDLYTARRLLRQVEWLRSHPDHVAVCAGFQTMDEAGRPVAVRVTEDDLDDVTDELLSGEGRSHMCAYLFRTAALRAVGGCREWFEVAEDSDLQFRLAAHGRIGYDPFVAYLYRLHDTSITHAGSAARRRFFNAYALEFLKERRDGGPDALQRGTPPTPPDIDRPPPRGLAKQNMQGFLVGESWRQHDAGRKLKAIHTGWRAVRAYPWRLAGWRSLAKLILKPVPLAPKS